MNDRWAIIALTVFLAGGVLAAAVENDVLRVELDESNGSLSVTDKRTAPSLTERPDSSEFADGKLSFFTLITKDTKSDKWITTYYVVDKTKNE